MELIQCSPLVLQMLERLGQLSSESLAELGANPGHTVSSPVLSTTHQLLLLTILNSSANFLKLILKQKFVWEM